MFQEALVIVTLSVFLYYLSVHPSNHSYDLFPNTTTSSTTHSAVHCMNDKLAQNHDYFHLASWMPKTEQDLPGECFFSTDYYMAKTQFNNLVEQAGGKLSWLPVVDDLTTQVAMFPGHAEKFLIHISGTHGVEAYAGTAIQAAILQYLRRNPIQNNPNAPTVVLVHALNAYGFKHNRRTNEDNVDLNRNFLTEEQWKMVKARDPNYAKYVDLDHVMNPTSKPFKTLILNELYTILFAVFNTVHLGFTNIKRAMVSGNYHKQTGYGFGGFEHTQSTKNLINLLVNQLDIPHKAKKVMLLDVHTGLGPMGVDTLLYLGSENFQDAELEKIFPSDFDTSNKELVIGALKAASFGESSTKAKVASGSRSSAEAEKVASGYDLTIGTTTEGFCTNMLAPHLHDADRICVTQVSNIFYAFYF